MKDFKIETESPLSIAEQIEVLELAKVVLIEESDHIMSYFGVCSAIKEASYRKYKKQLIQYGIDIQSFIPSFNINNALRSNTNAKRSVYWWSQYIDEGGLTNRLAFLDWLIERLKEVEIENTKRTTTE